MRIHSFGFLISALLSSALMSGCAGEGASSAHPAGALPGTAGSQPAASKRSASVRRTHSVPSCTGTGTDAFVGGGASNIAAGPETVAVGGAGNEVCDDLSSVVGGYYNAISSGNDTSQNTFIGGGQQNVIAADANNGGIVSGYNNQLSSADGAFIGSGENNVASALYAVIVGGDTNQNSGTDALLGGGSANKVSGPYGVVVGGSNNTTSGQAASIGGGGYNTAAGTLATVGGGYNNSASGMYATIPGGYINSAAGIYSYAAGTRANASLKGTFVWSDGSDGTTVLTPTQQFQFLARAAGGFTLYTNAGGTVGAQLGAGSGTWASLSDRNAKTNIAPLDDATVLAKVAQLPISRWSYKSERGVRHVGPMAQDFYAAFGVGEDDKHITSIDEDGVALAAIKALHAQTAGAQAAIRALRDEKSHLATPARR